MPKKLYIKTHGCQMNEYDSEKMSKLLVDKKNFEITTSEQDADLIILNTCSIREKAQERVFHQIGRWRKIKEKKPNLKIAIGGCVASQEGEKIIIFSDIVPFTLSGNELSLSASLIGNFDQINKLFVDYPFFILEDANEESISLIYN